MSEAGPDCGFDPEPARRRGIDVGYPAARNGDCPCGDRPLIISEHFLPMFFADHRPEVMRITLVPGFQCASGSGKLGYERFEDGLLELATLGPPAHLPIPEARSEGNGGVCTCSCRWSTYYLQK